MANYIPSENPQKLGVKNTGEAPLVNHVNTIRAHGPPPRNYRVERVRKSYRIRGNPISQNEHIQQYTNLSVAGAGPSRHHPLSPAGLQETPNPVIEREFVDERAICCGFFQPPFEYVPNQWIWCSYDNWEGAMADAFRAMGTPNKNRQPFQEADMTEMHENLKKNPQQYGHASKHVLYHPADRDAWIFEGEPECAMVAANVGYSLVIVCPLLNKSGEDWSRPWDIINRPPIRARFSTGRQADNRLMIMGCLPMATSLGTKRERKTLWFSLRPKSMDRMHPAWPAWGK